MKELSVEEKAKRYDEVIEKGKQIQNTPYTAHWDIMKEVTEYLLPELAESDDERIRKRLINYFHGFFDSSEDIYKVGGCVKWEGLDVKDVIIWLEKQSDCSSWNYNDVVHRDAAIRYLESIKSNNDSEYQMRMETINWLKSFRAKNSWKPSDEQLKQLEKHCPDNRPLTSLYEQLKKLKY